MSCTHGETYFTRFGDECCVSCHQTLAWLPARVSVGLYGDETSMWVGRMAKRLELNVDDAVRAFVLGYSDLGDGEEIRYVFPVAA